MDQAQSIPAAPRETRASPTGSSPILSIIVPTFNEIANIPLLIERLHAALGDIAWEVIFVDDNSPDGSVKLLREYGARDPRIRCIRRIGRRGLAGACIEGMLASSAPYLAVMDADLQHEESLLAEMLAILQRGEADIVVGSRYAGQDTPPHGLSQERLAGSRLANRLARGLLGLDLKDPMSGFFMIGRGIFEEVAPRLSGQGFKILADILASSPPHVCVRELPYAFRARLHGDSKLDSRVVLDFAGLIVAKATRDAVPVRFVGFLLVGATGILVHLLVLTGATEGLALPFVAAQTLGTIVSIASNFWLNNALTYRDQRLVGLAAVKGLLVFYVICAVGAISNIGVATWLYSNQPKWWVAGLLGSVVGATWNYAVSSVYVWRAPIA
ncbi:MAG TPA: glycosyltransferase family 2 protein [Pseudolabrys sp.]|nr:glycosyltransferase family 2 protein [Pseudolabrys sp.]